MGGFAAISKQPASRENFKLEFDPKVMEAVVNRIERNENIASKFLTDEDLRAVAIKLMMQEVYNRLRSDQPAK